MPATAILPVFKVGKMMVVWLVFNIRCEGHPYAGLPVLYSRVYRAVLHLRKQGKHLNIWFRRLVVITC